MFGTAGAATESGGVASTTDGVGGVGGVGALSAESIGASRPGGANERVTESAEGGAPAATGSRVGNERMT